jgi:hypothetical protein
LFYVRHPKWPGVNQYGMYCAWCHRWLAQDDGTEAVERLE